MRQRYSRSTLCAANEAATLPLKSFRYNGRRRGGILAAGGDHFRAQADLHKSPQFGGGTRGIGAGAHPDDVAGDLDGGEDESPGKAPPPQPQGEERSTKLALGRAGTAADLLRTAPTGQEERRPDPVDLVDVNGAESAAFGTVAPEHFFRLRFEHVSRDCLRNAQDISVLVTFVIAEAVGAVAHAAEKYRSAAVAALCHSLVSRLRVGLLVLVRRRAEGLAHAPGLLAAIQALDLLLDAPPFPWSGSGEGELVSGAAQSRLRVPEGRNMSSAGIRVGSTGRAASSSD